MLTKVDMDDNYGYLRLVIILITYKSCYFLYLSLNDDYK